MIHSHYGEIEGIPEQFQLEIKYLMGATGLEGQEVLFEKDGEDLIHRSAIGSKELVIEYSKEKNKFSLSFGEDKLSVRYKGEDNFHYEESGVIGRDRALEYAYSYGERILVATVKAVLDWPQGLPSRTDGAKTVKTEVLSLGHIEQLGLNTPHKSYKTYPRKISVMHTNKLEKMSGVTCTINRIRGGYSWSYLKITPRRNSEISRNEYVEEITHMADLQ